MIATRSLMIFVSTLMIFMNSLVIGISGLMKIIKRLMNFMRGLMIRLRPHTVFVKTGKAAASVTPNGKDGFVICNLRLDNNTRPTSFNPARKPLGITNAEFTLESGKACRSLGKTTYRCSL